MHTYLEDTDDVGTRRCLLGPGENRETEVGLKSGEGDGRPDVRRVIPKQARSPGDSYGSEVDFIIRSKGSKEESKSALESLELEAHDDFPLPPGRAALALTSDVVDLLGSACRFISTEDHPGETAEMVEAVESTKEREERGRGVRKRKRPK